MKKLLGMYTRMTNCCFIFSLQAGVVIIGVLGTVWTASSMLVNLFRPYDSTFTIHTLVQFVFAYSVLILICGGHVFLVLAGSWAHSNLMLIGFLYNSGVLLLWVTLSALSYLNNPQVTQIICIEGRCPDVLWLLDTYWRDTGEKCPAVTSHTMHLATREIFSIAPVLGYVSHWPDYIEQPGMGVPCYDNIPDTEHYVNYLNSGSNSSCPRADWLSWHPRVIQQRKTWHAYYNLATGVPKKPGDKPVYAYPYPPKKRSIIEDDYFNDVDDDDSAVKRTILNKTALFQEELLQQGCDLNDPQFMVVSYAISMFFACFFLYGRAVEFNYYHELVMPFTLETGRFRPSGAVIIA